MVNERFNLLNCHITALQDANVYARHICELVGRLFISVKYNRLEAGSYRPVLPAISELLNSHKIDPLLERWENIGFLIKNVRIPSLVPVDPFGYLTVDGMIEIPSAHTAAVTLFRAVHSYLSRKTQELCPDLGLVYDYRDAADKLVDRHWDTLRLDLADAARFDCEEIKIKIEEESLAAQNACNEIAYSATPLMTGPKESGGNGDGDIASKKCESELSSNISKKEDGQVDKKVDKKKLSTYPFTTEARKCARIYRKKREAKDKTSMKAVINDYIEANGGSFSYIQKCISCHPEEWKSPIKVDK